MLERQPPLLPADLYLANMLWPDVSPEEAATKYRQFRAEVESRVRIDPGQPQAGVVLGIISIVSAVIYVGLTIAASFFKPKAPEQGNGGITSTERQGSNLIVATRVAPQVGFDSVQQPTVLGSVIPVIWARREYLGPQDNPYRPAGKYGGIRVNLGLIWSQIFTIQGSQLLRAVFLLGEAPVAGLDHAGFAIGDNSLSTYEIQDAAASELVARATIYHNPNGGPIKSEHRILGRSAANDAGNSMNNGGPSVFCVRNAAQEIRPNFSYVTKPSTSTVFGLYSHIPNLMSLRALPRIKPTIRVTTKSIGDKGDFQVDCDDEPQALAEHWKSRYYFSLRSGITGTSGGEFLQPGDTITYTIDRRSDITTKIVFSSVNTDNSASETNGEATCVDIANVIASKQKSYDEALLIGEVYRIGSCLAVLVSREPANKVFISDADNEPPGKGQSMTYTFRVIRAGQVQTVVGWDYMDPNWSRKTINPEKWNRVSNMNSIDFDYRFKVCSSYPQIFRCAVATITLARSSRIFSLGIKSTVGITINGYTNLRDCKSLIKINQDAGMKYQSKRFRRNDKIGVTNFQSGTIQRNDTRVSCFQVYYREAGTTDWVLLDAVWGIKSSTGEACFNSMRFEMPTTKRWEVRFEPISSWELRTVGQLPAHVFVISDKSSNRNRSTLNNGVIVEWFGDVRNKDRTTFNLPWLDPKDNVQINKADSFSFLDDWAMVAESFVYDQIQTTISRGPEHEIVYVNTFSGNEIPPTYDNISTVGLNIYASTEFNQLPQFSAYVTEGRVAKRLLENDNSASTHLFPDILRNYLTNMRYGVGAVVGEPLIDRESFERSSFWCQKRRYFYDAADSTRVNLLQWAADIGAFHLLELNDRAGKWALVPAVYFPEDGPIPYRALFTAGNIIENTLKVQFLSDAERQPISVSVKWREERQRADLTSTGFFPVEREVFVREADRPLNDPIESIDLSSFCTNPYHAVDVACYVIRMRRNITHSISFSTTPDGLNAGLAAGDYIRVAMDFRDYDAFSHGVILADGTLLSTRADLFGPGTHDVVAWDGVSESLSEITVTVDENGVASPTGIMFARRTTTGQVRSYKVERISVNEDGTIDIEAVQHPVDEEGYSMITKNWTTYKTNNYWVIEGMDN